MVLKMNDDDDDIDQNKTVIVNRATSKPTTSAAAATSITNINGSTSSTNNNNYYSNEKRRSSSSSSSSSSSCSESSSDFDHSYKSLSSRIGNEFQVDLADYEVGKFTQNDIKLKEILVWRPTSKITDQDPCTKHAYTIEQALALLCWDNYDFSKALLHMKSYVPIPNEWTEEDKILFEQAYMFHGKNFSKIKQVLPDKSQASLVKFYYMWKKGRQYTSLIDSNQSNNKINNSEPVNSDQNEQNNNDSDDLNGKDDNEDDDSHFTNNVNKICCNCDLITSELQSTPKGMLCDPCYAYWKETGGLMRPDIMSKSNRPGSSKDDYRNNFGVNNSREAKNFQKSLRKPPKGIYLNYDELVNLVEVDSDQTFDMLNKKLYCLKKEVQLNKQKNSSLVAKLADEVESKITIDERLMQIYDEAVESSCWTEHEIALVIQGFNKYANDFAAIAQVLQTKSENSVKAFYNYYKDHFNLDKLILNNPKELKTESVMIFNELTKLNSVELPTTESINQQQQQKSQKEIKDELSNNTSSLLVPVVKIEPPQSETKSEITIKKSDNNDLILID